MRFYLHVYDGGLVVGLRGFRERNGNGWCGRVRRETVGGLMAG